MLLYVLFEPGDGLSKARRGDGWDIGGCLKEHFLNSSCSSSVTGEYVT